MNNNIGICFAKEDKSLFLEGLIEKLNENQDIEISRIEILPDVHSNSSTIINCSKYDALILIISKHNKDTSWVHKALKIVRMQVLTSHHKIIPVIIDKYIDLEQIPVEQEVRLLDHDDYSFELYNIRTLAGMHISEHLNFSYPVKALSGDLSNYTNRIFLLLCKEALELDYPLLSVRDFLKKNNFNRDKFITSLYNLKSSGLIEQLITSRMSYTYPDMIRLSGFGLNKYFHICFQNYVNLRKCVIEFIIGNNSALSRNALRSEIISKMLNQSKLIINTILEDLESSGKILFKRTFGENWEIIKVNHCMFENVLKASYACST